jgi:hypothetical protein
VENLVQEKPKVHKQRSCIENYFHCTNEWMVNASKIKRFILIEIKELI